MRVLSRNPALRVISLYAFLSGLWIFGTDHLLTHFTTNYQELTYLQTYKGVVFIIGSAILFFFVLHREFRKREQAEKSLEENRRAFSTLMDNLPGVFYRCQNDPNWTMDFINEGCRALTGYIPEDLTGNSRVSYADLIHPEDRDPVWKEVQRALRRKDPFQLTYRIRTANDEEKWVLAQGCGVFSPERHLEAIEGYITDITRQKQAEEELRRYEAQQEEQNKLTVIGQLAAGIAHDFNNILTVMMGSAQILAMREAPSEAMKEDLDTICIQGQRAAQLIRQVLDFSRRTVAERKPIDLLPYLKEAMKLLERTLPSSIEIHTNFPEERFIVEANLTQIQQVITNLAVNAKDAMPEGGELRVGLSHLEIGRIEQPPIPEMDTGDWVVWTVSDTGTGMSEEIAPRIFEPFFTTKASKGTGLGLSQVYGIVKQHGGFIDVRTEEGAGTTFTIYLPGSSGSEQDEPLETTPLPTGRGRTVLIVDDMPEVLQVTEKMLEALDYRVLKAGNGREALGIYDTHRNEIGLVLTDMVMPQMGGAKLCEALKQKDPEVRIAVITGYPAAQEEPGYLPPDIVGYIEKPLTVEKVADVVEKAFQREDNE